MDFDDLKGLIISVGLMLVIGLFQQVWEKLKSRFSHNNQPEPPREQAFEPVIHEVAPMEVPRPAQAFENPELEGISAVETPVARVETEATDETRRRRRRRLAQTIVAGEILRPRFRTFDEF